MVVPVFRSAGSDFFDADAARVVHHAQPSGRPKFPGGSLWINCAPIYIPQAQAVSLPEVPCDSENVLRLDGIAKYLKVNVVKPNGNKVRLTMPARVADNIKEIIDPPVMESIERQKIDLAAIQKRVHQSGFIPQTLFDLKDPEREVLVWLE